MNILVTGAAGFLGSHLVDALLAQGHQVFGYDDLSTGSIQNLPHHQNFHFAEGDVRDPYYGRIGLLSGVKFNQIYNLACPASPPVYQKDPVRTLETSVIGIQNAIKVAMIHEARLFHASTSEVYGDTDVLPTPEIDPGCVNTWGPRSCYDEGKRVAETFLHDYHHQYGLDIRMARIFNTYGPRMKEMDGRVVSNFILQGLSGIPFTLYGTGQQTRSFCYVSDTIAGLIALMNYEGRECFEPFNVGNPSPVTMEQLALVVARELNVAPVMEHRPLPVDDPRRRVPMIERITRLVGWRPTINLDDGVRMTIAAFRKRRSG